MLPPGRSISSEARLHGIEHDRVDDRNLIGSALSGPGPDSADRDDQVDLACDEILGKASRPLQDPFGEAGLERDGLAVHVAVLCKRLTKALKSASRPLCTITPILGIDPDM